MVEAMSAHGLVITREQNNLVYPFCLAASVVVLKWWPHKIHIIHSILFPMLITMVTWLGENEYIIKGIFVKSEFYMATLNGK